MEKQAIDRYNALKRFYSTFIKLINGDYEYFDRWNVFKNKPDSIGINEEPFLKTPYKALNIEFAFWQLKNCNGIPFTLAGSLEQMLEDYCISRKHSGLSSDPASVMHENSEIANLINRERKSWARNPIVKLLIAGGKMGGNDFSQEAPLKFGFEIGYYFNPHNGINIGLGIVPILEFREELITKGTETQLLIKGKPVALDGHKDYQTLVHWVNLQFPEDSRTGVFEF